MKSLPLLLALIIIFFSACFKGKHPDVTIFTPTNEQSFNAPEIIEITADLKDTHDALEGEYLVVTKVNSRNDTVAYFEDHAFRGNTDVYHLKKSFYSEANTRYKIVVKATGEGVYSDSVFVNAN